MNTKKKNSPTPEIKQGRLMPQAQDSEEILLASLISHGEIYPRIETIIRAEDFYSESNRCIFRAAGELYAANQPISIASISETAKKNGTLELIGGVMYIAKLATGNLFSTRFEYYANVIRQKSIARKLILSADKIVSRSFDAAEDIADIIESYEKDLTDITTDISGCESIDMPEAIRRAVEKASQIQSDRQSGKLTAIPTGLNALDNEFAGGWRDPDLIVIGARPSMGKTQHALSFAKAASQAGMDVMFASIEMTAVQLVNRYFLEDERISSYNLRTGQMLTEEWEAIDQRSCEMRDIKLHIADSHNIRHLANIKSEARRLHRAGKLKLLIIDYLQLITTNTPFQNRHLEIGYITKELKNLAKELGIPVILLSQLSRALKGDKGTEPALNDLKESGEIENDADIVLFIHKPDYYNPQAADKSGKPWEGRGKLIIAKYREGARNQFVIFHHDRRYKKIFDQDRLFPEPKAEIKNWYEPDRNNLPF